MSKLNNMRRELENAFTDALHQEFRCKFDVELQTEFNIFAMCLISKRTDGKDLTPEQHAFLAGWSTGYGKAINMILLRDSDDEYQREIKRQAREDQ